MAALYMTRVSLERDPVCDGRRSRGGVVSDLRERRLLLTVELRGHHLRLDALMCARRRTVAIIVIIVIVAAVEIRGTLVLVGAAMLGHVSSTCAWRAARTAPTYVLISADELVHVGRGVFVELLVVAEDEDGDVDGAEDGELVRLLEETALALEKGSAQAESATRRLERGARHVHRAVAVILDGLDLDLPSTHGGGCEA